MDKSYLISVLCLVCLCSCGIKSNNKEVTFEVVTSEETNFGVPFYGLAKNVNDLDFFSQSYKNICDEIASSRASMNDCQKFIVIPGENNTITLRADVDKHPAVYFVFSDPGESWKYCPIESNERNIKLKLGENSIIDRELARKKTKDFLYIKKAMRIFKINKVSAFFVKSYRYFFPLKEDVLV